MNETMATDQASGMRHIEFIDRGEYFLIRFLEDYSEEKRKKIKKKEKDDRGSSVWENESVAYSKRTRYSI